ncbi:hypothetical protein N8I71_13700 [Roseibacterium sp. SDUM158016]|jgi:hypothetical protein|uniref:hypothetical protein n=1 Tax=Roseicyclus sediminis TaxID=2980997 RepID=UPI0021CF072C|nr:hypothetical protein [Roseibacterium sp. SDUM158016]MCU4653894.1 hypothetical protein [Roseibacterium sp. SDUM158016]
MTDTRKVRQTSGEETDAKVEGRAHTELRPVKAGRSGDEAEQPQPRPRAKVLPKDEGDDDLFNDMPV